MSSVKKFSQQLLNLAKTMSRRFPEDKDLLLAVRGLEVFVNHNPRKLMNVFISNVYLKSSDSGKKYSELVKERNEEYFLTNTLIDKKKITDNESSTLNMIGSIKEHWKDLNDDEKSNIWIYLDVLFNLTEKYISAHLEKQIS